jgi:hypothetical protein
MRSRFAAVVAVVAAMLPVSASAGILVKVDLSQQQMTVDVDGKRSHVWPVSTANAKHVTPTGSYSPQRMHKMWYSRKYDDAPMPHAIFYSGGYAIHGTYSVGMLGRPASHGCVRLAPGNAAALFYLVQKRGMGATRIVITGTPPKYREPAVAQRRQEQRASYAQASYEQPGLLTSLFGWSDPATSPAARPPARPQRMRQVR